LPCLVIVLSCLVSALSGLVDVDVYICICIYVYVCIFVLLCLGLVLSCPCLVIVVVVSLICGLSLLSVGNLIASLLYAFKPVLACCRLINYSALCVPCLLCLCRGQFVCACTCVACLVLSSLRLCLA
jgi:hypothetical protein